MVLLLTVPTYLYDKKKEELKVYANRIRINPNTRLLEIYNPERGELETILRARLAQIIPIDLKPDRCSCDVFTAQQSRLNPKGFTHHQGTCLSCFDWAYRSNLRVTTESKPSDDSFCYRIMWQSYDALTNPPSDCFLLGDEQWFGLGDIIGPSLSMNKQTFDWTPLNTGIHQQLFPKVSTREPRNNLEFGSYVNFTLFSTNGVLIGDMKSDLSVSLRLSVDSKSGSRKLCFTTSCTDRCSHRWDRIEDLDKFRHLNNFMEYSICSSSKMNALISKQLEERAQPLLSEWRKPLPDSSHANLSGLELAPSGSIKRRTRGSELQIIHQPSDRKLNARLTGENDPELPEGIGLVERAIFATSPEFMPSLDGQALRLYVDTIVKMGLKISPILIIDSRWEVYAGSLKLNTALFPKAKLLFEILHNKGFKIIFTLKPFIDTSIGIGNINQLFEAGRLVGVTNVKDTRDYTPAHVKTRTNRSITETVTRRKSLFSFGNQSIEVEPMKEYPLIFRCSESQEALCALVDLGQAANRAWMRTSINRSSLLTSEADGIQIGGCHPSGLAWDDHYRGSVSKLARSLFYHDKLYVLPQWTGDFGYIQLAPRNFDWNALRSVLSSTLNLGMMGFALVHPGSVWGDLRTTNLTRDLDQSKAPNRMESIYGDLKPNRDWEGELLVRWLQMAIFMPILQFNDVSPIERHGLHDLVQDLVRIRKAHIVPELKKNLPFTPLVGQTETQTRENRLPLIRPVWLSQESGDSIVGEQFTIGADILVAPILSEASRQRDIYLPSGFWRDELRKTDLRGGKWLQNYPIELNEVAWFTRVTRK